MGAVPVQTYWPTSTRPFSWVGLARRIPLRIDFDSASDGVKLVAGQTAIVIVQESDKK
jgi:multidrug resistance efflux pump